MILIIWSNNLFFSSHVWKKENFVNPLPYGFEKLGYKTSIGTLLINLVFPFDCIVNTCVTLYYCLTHLTINCFKGKKRRLKKNNVNWSLICFCMCHKVNFFSHMPTKEMILYFLLLTPKKDDYLLIYSIIFMQVSRS
jgi:hypothetical protein